MYDGFVYGGRYRLADTSPTSIVVSVWFNALVVGWNTTDSELHATDAIVTLAHSVGGLLFWRQLQQSTLPEV
jgi:hypothetical protein